MEGEKIAKVKVGLYEAVRDGMVVNLLLEAVPDLRLRRMPTAAGPVPKRMVSRNMWHRSTARIDFLEEPCKTPEESLCYAQDTGIAIARDESVREPGFTVTAQPGVAAIVIKPTLTGSIARCRELITAAHREGLQAVISSSVESSFGLTQLARLAGWLTPDTLRGWIRSPDAVTAGASVAGQYTDTDNRRSINSDRTMVMTAAQWPWVAHAQQTPDKTALRCADSSLTWTELAALADARAAGFYQQGLRESNCVVLRGKTAQSW